MLQKQVFFNVGGALSSYLEFNENKIVLDLGQSENFNPITNFLLPLANIRKFPKNFETKKYSLTQTYLSHLDNDHISAINDFDKYFTPELLTTPCEHPKQNDIFNVIKNFFLHKNPNRDKVLELMKIRKPGYGTGTLEDFNKPLVVHRECLDYIKLFHIPANECCNDEIFKKQDYSNNTSLVLLIIINGHKILMPGDLTQMGMRYLIEDKRNIEFKDFLEKLGVDFLIAPHHGLTTSFPDILFETMKENKTNRLNIISEKTRTSLLGGIRSDVDNRYYRDTHCLKRNNLNQYGRKTSRGHIVINYANSDPEIKIIELDNTELLIKEFTPNI